MRKNRLKACGITKIRAEKNQSDPSKNLFGNKILNNIIKDKNLLTDLDIFNHKFL